VSEGRARSAGPAADGGGGDWEHFAHGADIGVRGWGQTAAQAFEQAAVALTAVITDPSRVRPLVAVPVHCRAPDLELLLYEWLNNLVFHMATQHLLFSAFTVTIVDGELEAEARGERVDVERHAPAVEVKGATLSELAVRLDPGGRWRAQCILDV
jgi:tRNA nucleotidyltransferase (CCA-adding enzyme)